MLFFKWYDPPPPPSSDVARDEQKKVEAEKTTSKTAQAQDSTLPAGWSLIRRPFQTDGGGEQYWRIPPHARICAPMVGGSELAFRLLCRRYDCDLAYTPMIHAARSVVSTQYTVP